MSEMIELAQARTAAAGPARRRRVRPVRKPAQQDTTQCCALKFTVKLVPLKSEYILDYMMLTRDFSFMVKFIDRTQEKHHRLILSMTRLSIASQSYLTLPSDASSRALSGCVRARSRRPPAPNRTPTAPRRPRGSDFSGRAI